MQASSHAEHHPAPAEPTVQPVPAGDGVTHVESEPVPPNVPVESGEKPETETKQTQENHDGDVGKSSAASQLDSTKDQEHAQDSQHTSTELKGPTNSKTTQHDAGSTQHTEHTQEQSQANKPVSAVSQEPQQVSQDMSDRIGDEASMEKTPQGQGPEHVSPHMNTVDETHAEKILQKHETHAETTPQEPQHANGNMNTCDETHMEKTPQDTNQVDQVDEHHDKGQHIQAASSDEKTQTQFLFST